MRLLHVLIIAFILSQAIDLQAQKNRFRFAQSYFGLQSDVLIGASTDIPAMGALRIALGGTHFWNKADFYITFPLLTTSFDESPAKYSEGVITGGRYLPFGLKSKYPTPFIGLQWITPRFSYGEGPEWNHSRLGLEAGFSIIVKKQYTLEASFHYIEQPVLSYPTGREDYQDLYLHNTVFSINFKKYLDFTAGNASPEGQAYLEKTMTKFEKSRSFSAWNVALGLSSNLTLQQYQFAEGYSFLPESTGLSLLPDVAIGYYMHKTDMAVRMSFRPVNTGQDAYGLNWELMEYRLAAEGFKFLFDYHGFVPFLGLGAGASHTELKIEDDGMVLTNVRGWQPQLSLILGWDIRPTPVDWFILRTNIRYSPDLKIELDGIKVSNQNLEINFIQFVFYPKRFKNQKE